jgi:hypothetical protein
MADEIELRVRDLEWRVKSLEDERNARQGAAVRMPSFWLSVIMAVVAIVSFVAQIFLAGWSP